jgi:type VI secretion system protein VasI
VHGAKRNIRCSGVPGGGLPQVAKRRISTQDRDRFREGEMKWILSLLGFLLAGQMAYAEDCSSIADRFEQIACRGRARIPSVLKEKATAAAQGGMARTSPAPDAVPGVDALGKWRIRREKSIMSDRINVTVYVESNEIIDCGWNKGARITLVMQCEENTTRLYFATGCHMTSSEYDGYGVIQYRLDDDPPGSVKGDESTDKRALGLWRGKQSIPLIRKMLGKSSLAARMTPFGENPFIATFDIGGVDSAASVVRKECGW